jgi:hypothetical protein
VRIIDRDGNEQSWAWLCQRYGEPIIRTADPGLGWRIAELREIKDPPQGAQLAAAASPAATNTLIVSTRGANGRPAAGVNVAWYWPDAPENPAAMPTNGLPLQVRPNRAVIGPTNDNGDAGFGMGRGAYYWPTRDEIGPHAAWIAGANSDVILGLGMIAGTAHDHIDVIFQQASPEDPPPPTPTLDLWQELFRRLDRIIALLERKAL